MILTFWHSVKGRCFSQYRISYSIYCIYTYTVYTWLLEATTSMKRGVFANLRWLFICTLWYTANLLPFGQGALFILTFTYDFASSASLMVPNKGSAAVFACLFMNLIRSVHFTLLLLVSWMSKAELHISLILYGSFDTITLRLVEFSIFCRWLMSCYNHWETGNSYGLMCG